MPPFPFADLWSTLMKCSTLVRPPSPFVHLIFLFSRPCWPLPPSLIGTWRPANLLCKLNLSVMVPLSDAATVHITAWHLTKLRLYFCFTKAEQGLPPACRPFFALLPHPWHNLPQVAGHFVFALKDDKTPSAFPRDVAPHCCRPLCELLACDVTGTVY
jgi:hypothetical protein